MKTLTFMSEGTKSTVLVPPVATDASREAYVKLTPGSMAINMRAVVTMGEATDLVLTLKSADDATGTNATDFPVVVPLYVDGVRQEDAKTYTVSEDTGEFIVDFCVDPGLIPDGKFVGIHAGASNALNLICTTSIEDSTDKPSA